MLKPPDPGRGPSSSLLLSWCVELYFQRQQHPTTYSTPRITNPRSSPVGRRSEETRLGLERFQKGLLGWSREETRKPEHFSVRLWPVRSHEDIERKSRLVSALAMLTAWGEGLCNRGDQERLQEMHEASCAPSRSEVHFLEVNPEASGK